MDEATNTEDRNAASLTLREDLRKIVHHGKCAETIGRVLQQHIRTGTAYEYFEAVGNKT